MKCSLRLSALDGHQRVEGLLPTSPPQTDLFPLQPDCVGDHPVEHAVKCQYDQPCPLHKPLWRGCRANDLL